MNYALLIFTLLASVRFFNYHNLVSEQFGKFFLIAGVLACLCSAFLKGKRITNDYYPRLAFAVLISSLAISIPMGAMFHAQSLLVTAIATAPYIMAYMLFYALMRMDIEPLLIVKAYFVLCFVSSIVFLVNFFTFPNNAFGEPIINEDLSRGILRVYINFIEVFPLLVFYCINQWNETNKPKWVAGMAYFGLFIILSVIRQLILLTALLGTWFLLKRVSWRMRILALVLMGGGIYVAMTQIPMFEVMASFTEGQRKESENKENIRVTSWRYFTYGNQTNALTGIFGNGMPSIGNSKWGNQYDSVTAFQGTFAVDVGWAGFYWYFGIFGLAALLYIIFRALLKPKPPSQQYLNYWLVYMFITSFASGIPVYYYQILNLMVILYMAYREPAYSALGNSLSSSSRWKFWDSTAINRAI